MPQHIHNQPTNQPTNDKHKQFYTLKDHLDRPYRVMRHKVGTPPASDVLVYEESDEAFYVGIGRDASDGVLYISCGARFWWLLVLFLFCLGGEAGVDVCVSTATHSPPHV
jgi:protease II